MESLLGVIKMTSSTMARLERQFKLRKEAEAPPPATSGLGEAIEQIIRQQVEERVAEQMERQKPYQNPRVPMHLRDFTDKAPSSEFPEPPTRTAPPPRDMTVQLHRDEFKRVNKVSIGDVVFNVQRNQEGRVVRMVTDGDATPPVPPASLNKG